MSYPDQMESRWRLTNRSGKVYVDINPIVFFSTIFLILLFLALSLVYLTEFSYWIDKIQAWIANQTGWFFVLVVNIILFYLIFLLFTPHANIRLGGVTAKPDFSYMGWFAMLFSAGMGIGLMFYSVAEPVYHLISPPHGAEPYTIAAYKDAISTTYLHWGLHAWSIYALTGLAIAYFSSNYKLMSIRNVFHPIFGDRIASMPGNIIDTVAAIATLFGVATSLGLGVIQINAGLQYLFGLSMNNNNQLLLITVITMIATGSVVLGLKRGIQRLSVFNICIALILLFYVMFVGPTLFNLNAFVENIGLYLDKFFYRSFWNETYVRGDWQNTWTVFYWGWWIAWSPFVGMFVARISYGRTIREFIITVLLLSSLVTFFWLSVFGSTALFIEMKGQGVIANAVQENIASSLFIFLEQLPNAGGIDIPHQVILLMGALATLVIVTFFVTSSDSGSLIIDILTAGGNMNPPVSQRIFWAVTEGVVAATLLVVGGLKALQTAAISSGIFIACLLLLMIISLHRSLQKNS